MITCPNCGNPVREGQQFCGSCGTDVQAALAAAAAIPAAPAVEEPAATPYAYSQPSSGYGYDYQPPLQPSGGNSRMIIIGVAIVLVACCMLACGIVLGFEIIPDILGLGTNPATPKVTPTPVGLLQVIQYFVI